MEFHIFLQDKVAELVQVLWNKLEEDFLPQKDWICDRLIEPLIHLSEKIISSRDGLTVSLLHSIVSVVSKQAMTTSYLTDKAASVLTRFSYKVFFTYNFLELHIMINSTTDNNIYDYTTVKPELTTTILRSHIGLLLN